MLGSTFPRLNLSSFPRVVDVTIYFVKERADHFQSSCLNSFLIHKLMVNRANVLHHSFCNYKITNPFKKAELSLVDYESLKTIEKGI